MSASYPPAWAEWSRDDKRRALEELRELHATVEWMLENTSPRPIRTLSHTVAGVEREVERMNRVDGAAVSVESPQPAAPVNADGEHCESNSPNCGPVVAYDVDGVPMCFECSTASGPQGPFEWWTDDDHLWVRHRCLTDGRHTTYRVPPPWHVEGDAVKPSFDCQRCGAHVIVGPAQRVEMLWNAADEMWASPATEQGAENGR